MALPQKQTLKDRWEILFAYAKLHPFLIGLVFLIGLQSRLVGHANINFPLSYMLIFAFASLFANLLVYLSLKKRQEFTTYQLDLMALLLIVPDLVIFTLVVLMGGGLDSPGFSFYAASIVVVSYLFSLKGLIFFTFFSNFLYAATIFGIYWGTLPYYQRLPYANPAYLHWSYFLPSLLTRHSLLFLIAFLSFYFRQLILKQKTH